ncbi:hypothetical protein J1614_000709 [Plenodomus biglobosus]|nr:hypothetical protein J1614_000709 [Plenodomus biglobosus]
MSQQHFTKSGAGPQENLAANVHSTHNEVTVLGGDACTRRIVIDYLDGVDMELTLRTAVADDGTITITIARFHSHHAHSNEASDKPPQVLDEAGNESDKHMHEYHEKLYEHEYEHNANEIYMHGTMSPSHASPTSSRRSSIWGLDDVLADPDQRIDTSSSPSCSPSVTQSLDHAAAAPRQAPKHSTWYPLDPQDFSDITNLLSDDDDHANAPTDLAPNTLLSCPLDVPTPIAFSNTSSSSSSYSSSLVLSWDDGDFFSSAADIYGRPRTPFYRNSADFDSELSEDDLSPVSEPGLLSWDGGVCIKLFEAVARADALRVELKCAVAALDV